MNVSSSTFSFKTKGIDLTLHIFEKNALITFKKKHLLRVSRPFSSQIEEAKLELEHHKGMQNVEWQEHLENKQKNGRLKTQKQFMKRRKLLN